MAPNFAFKPLLLGLSAASAARIARKKTLAPRKLLESDPILSAEEYEAVAAASSGTASAAFPHNLVVKFIDEAHLRADGTQALTSTSSHACAGDVSAATKALGVSLAPLLEGVGPELEDLARRAEKMSGLQQPDLRSLMKVQLAVEDAQHLVEAAQHFDSMGCVEYVAIEGAEPPALPQINEESDPYMQVACHRGELPKNGSLPDFSWAQGYHYAGQLEADYLHRLGANGKGMMYADCEFSVNFDHAEFKGARFTEEADYPVGPNFTDHGTASVSITLGGDDGVGIKGLASKADGYFFSELPASGRYNRQRAITAAIAKVRPGDVVLLEMQWHASTSDPYGPAELVSSVWQIVKMGADAGVVVVAAAGNGNRNLDGRQDRAYMRRGDSGAIIVGAGSPEHVKTSFSTYGQRVDVQAWGDWSVMTAGYGKCLGFPGYDVAGSRYTKQYSGTSSASAIVAGAVTLFQSWALEELGAPLMPLELRDILKSTSRPQKGDDSDGRVGGHLNLRAAVEAARALRARRSEE